MHRRRPGRGRPLRDLSLTHDGYTIREGRPDEAGLLRGVERAAGAMFADVGLAEVAAHEPWPETGLIEHAEAGRLYVADCEGVAVGFLLWDIADGTAYIEEIAVHPGHAGHRLAARLISRTEDAARKAGIAWLTLSTFRSVPWNAPYYVRLGFSELPESEFGPEMREIERDEARRGLTDRVFMRRALAAASR